MPHKHQDSDLFPFWDASAPGIWTPPVPSCDWNARGPLPLDDAPAHGRDESPPPDHEPEAGQLWLSGDVLMCACPDCGAPMSVRVWLMIADCWRCGTSIELSEEQERQARQLLRQREDARQREARRPHEAPAGKIPVQPAAAPALPARPVQPRHEPGNGKPAPSPPPATAPPRSAPTAPTPSTSSPHPLLATAPAPANAVPQPAAPPPQPPRAIAATRPVAPRARPAVASRIRARLGHPTQARRVTAWISDLFGTTPAWLVSLVVHLILLTLLSLLTIDALEEEGPYITLSTKVRREVSPGGEVVMLDPEHEVVFDLPLPTDLDLTDPKQRETVLRADQDARELRLDPEARDPNLPDLARVKHSVGTVGGPALAARDPRIRAEVVRREGGTTLTEAAVARGLRWLALHQNRDGSWSLDRFNHSAGCTCDGMGTHSDAAGTSLALLPFLGAGQTHLVGIYQDHVSRGLRWLLEHQKGNGDLRANSSGNAGMYAHGQAAIVLCEAYLMTGDEALRRPAQKALDFIVEAQHDAGGWRYEPRQAGDTSVVGWQLMALQSGRAARLHVPEETMELAGHFLDSVAHSRGAQYSYLPGQGPTHVMTAEALLCRMYLGWKLDIPGLRQGVEYLVDEHLPDRGHTDIYYWYYGTQTLHHHGGREWERWNARMREILVETQERRGHEAGSWSPRGPHASAGGRIYMTALAVCCLEVYYRHLPIFRQIDLD